MGGGLLLPIAGNGAFSIDSANAARLPVTEAPLPFSAECLELRALKRRLLAFHLEEYGGGSDERTRRHMALVDQYGVLAAAIAARPATWTTAVELAEVAWHWAEKETITVNDGSGPAYSVETGRIATDSGASWNTRGWRGQVNAALIEAVLTLGGGERFDHDLERNRHG